jgi:hypothetical protein
MQTSIIETTRVIKDIDPVQVASYRMKQIYMHRNDEKKALSKVEVVPNHDSLRKRIILASAIPTLYAKK